MNKEISNFLLDLTTVYSMMAATVSIDAGFTIHNESGFADNKHCFNLALLWIFNFMLLY